MTWQSQAEDLKVLDSDHEPMERRPFWLRSGESPKRETEPVVCNTATSFVRVQFRIQNEVEPTWQQVLAAAQEAGAFDCLSHPDEDVWDEEPT